MKMTPEQARERMKELCNRIQSEQYTGELLDNLEELTSLVERYGSISVNEKGNLPPPSEQAS